MTQIPVKVKWGKIEFDLAVDASKGFSAFRQQLQALTKVPADKQKLLGIPGGLKDGDDLSAKIKAGAKLTLLGTAEDAQLQNQIMPGGQHQDRGSNSRKEA